MADHPMIFSAPMVRAILAWRKTQTRRVLSHKWPVSGASWAGRSFDVLWQGFGWQWAEAINGDDPHIRLPWEHPGDAPPDPGYSAIYRIRPPIERDDVLWVRETWQAPPEYNLCAARGIPNHEDILYLADRPHGPKWDSRVRSPRHMPRWASRITLRVTDLRVQRLQDITEADAVAEGARSVIGDGKNGWIFDDFLPVYLRARSSFADFWCRVHGNGAWDANPWVAAYTFEKMTGESNA